MKQKTRVLFSIVNTATMAAVCTAMTGIAVFGYAERRLLGDR